MSNLFRHKIVVGANLDTEDLAILNYIFYPLAGLETIRNQLSQIVCFIVSDQEYLEYAPEIIKLGYPIPWLVLQTPQADSNFTAQFAQLQQEFADKPATVKVLPQEASLIEPVAQLIRNYIKNPPTEFFSLLKEYTNERSSTFACPGHQDGKFYQKHPLGQAFYDFYGPNIFRSDICNSDSKMGDLLVHQGAAKQSQKNTAKIYGADKTYYVLNGTSSANKVIANALLSEEDLVLFDRNNHKSCHAGAMTQVGATPIYLETSRNAYGFIGGIYDHCYEEQYLYNLIAEQAPNHVLKKRPFRLAIIQLGTYDGTLSNPRDIINKIGHLCDYILFDSAWVGYEAFVDILDQVNPLSLELGPEDPGILVTQSVHKQQAGFSQASQIHKKDRHIKGQDRYLNHKRLNHSYMIHASTSPFYPIYASIDVNAAINGSNIGKSLWIDCLVQGIEFRKQLIEQSKYIKPFVDIELWNSATVSEIASDLKYFDFVPGKKWHNFEGYAAGQYHLDPFKILLTTPGIDIENNLYQEHGMPSNILACYLTEQGIIPEKSDLNSILFLSTPSQTPAKLEQLLQAILRFEELYDANALVSEVLPSTYQAYHYDYQDAEIYKLCQEMHSFYRELDLKTIQAKLFRKEFFPKYLINPYQANVHLVKNQVELVAIRDIKGRVAAMGALPYPPGIYAVVGGEEWSETAVEYFIALEQVINRFPGFASVIQGVYLTLEPTEQDPENYNCYSYVIKEEFIKNDKTTT